MVCDFPRLVNSPPEKFAVIAADFNNVKPTYKSLLTGVVGLSGIGMVILMTIAFTLATRLFRKNVVKLPFPFNRLTGFNAFWYSHHLLALVYILFLVHGSFLFLVHKWYQKSVRTFNTRMDFEKLIVSIQNFNCIMNSKMSQTWMYISVPLLLYVAERSLRTCRSGHYAVKILKVTLSDNTSFPFCQILGWTHTRLPKSPNPTLVLHQHAPHC